MNLFIPSRKWKTVDSTVLEVLALDHHDFLLDILTIVSAIDADDDDTFMKLINRYPLEETDVILDDDWLALYTHEVLTIREVFLAYLKDYGPLGLDDIVVLQVYMGKQDDRVLGYLFTSKYNTSGNEDVSSHTTE